jgi:hypothetical protein
MPLKKKPVVLGFFFGGAPGGRREGFGRAMKKRREIDSRRQGDIMNVMSREPRGV